MDHDLAQVVANSVRRARRLCAETVELCSLTRELHTALRASSRCPVCGRVGVSFIFRANLSKSESASVLARRCPGGHIYTQPAASE
jgi:hypothetical protein